MIASACWPCIVNFHEECYAPRIADEDVPDTDWVVCCCSGTDHDDSATIWAKEIGRGVAEPSDITEVRSTGRKRAAMLYPIYENMECEWAWLKHAGGGVKPIIGCSGNTIDPVKSGNRAGHRHHGPDKNTINNGPLNVHRICASCHNRYHALNNKYYIGERPPADQPWVPVAPEGMTVAKHDPETMATDEERTEYEAWWATRPSERTEIED